MWSNYSSMSKPHSPKRKSNKYPTSITTSHLGWITTNLKIGRSSMSWESPITRPSTSISLTIWQSCSKNTDQWRRYLKLAGIDLTIWTKPSKNYRSCFELIFWFIYVDTIILMNKVGRALRLASSLRFGFSQVTRPGVSTPTRRERLQFSKQRLVDFGELPHG